MTWLEQTQDSWLKVATWNVNTLRQKMSSPSVPICSNWNHSNLVRFQGQFMVISQPTMCTLFQLLRPIPRPKRGGSYLVPKSQQLSGIVEMKVRYNSADVPSENLCDWRSRKTFKSTKRFQAIDNSTQHRHTTQHYTLLVHEKTI